MNKNLLSLADLSRKEIEDLISFAEKFINEDGSFRKESLFQIKQLQISFVNQVQELNLLLRLLQKI